MLIISQCVDCVKVRRSQSKEEEKVYLCLHPFSISFFPSILSLIQGQINSVIRN
ncbi:hypothetical protein EXN66_Car014076 [Channa argus]|uniref:Uncharacterized protein n=1 Tax=Channa argus TaxID=215402 RepID=A0A6G1Q767_CHAAH|nr:hypothetical protein EXN66_Car014076 [Channa argus]